MTGRAYLRKLFSPAYGSILKPFVGRNGWYEYREKMFRGYVRMQAESNNVTLKGEKAILRQRIPIGNSRTGSYGPAIPSVKSEYAAGLIAEIRNVAWLGGEKLATIDGKRTCRVRVMTNKKPVVRLPEGYSSWLDYALNTLDVRALEINALFNEDSTFNRDAVRLAARQELDELRNKAAMLDKLLAKNP